MAILCTAGDSDWYIIDYVIVVLCVSDSSIDPFSFMVLTCFLLQIHMEQEISQNAKNNTRQFIEESNNISLVS